MAPILIAAAAVVVIGAGLRAIVLSEGLRARELKISGCRRVDRGEIVSLAARAIGRPLLLLDIDGLRLEIEQVPEVSSVVVARRLPAMLDLRIVERVAVARCRLAGALLLVDADGHLFPAGVGLPGDEQLPQLVGLSTGSTEPVLSAGDRVGLQALAEWTQATGGSGLAGLLVDLSHSDRIALREKNADLPLWLDRQDPSLNLRELVTRRREIRSIARGRAVDLRFPHRLTIVPPAGATRRR